MTDVAREEDAYHVCGNVGSDWPCIAQRDSSAIGPVRRPDHSAIFLYSHQFAAVTINRAGSRVFPTRRFAFEASLRGQNNDTFAQPLNGEFFLRVQVEVLDDALPDALMGVTQRDWFLASLEDSLDQLPGERLN